jgi:ligand-binding sensor domain-containing protein
MQKAAFLFICIWVHCSLNGQIQQPIFDHYSNEQGFIGREAFSMVSDQNGLIWISTDEGLASYDSKTFRFYKHQPSDSNSLFHNYCKELLIDKRGWIWIITKNNLDVFNPITQQFKHVKLSGENGNTQPVYPNKLVYNKETDIVWIAAASGLYFCKNGKLLPERFIKSQKNNFQLHKFISTISIENNTILWLTTDSSTLRIDTRNGSIENYIFPQIISGFRNHSFGVISSYFDKKNTLWLGLWVNGLLEFNTITKKFNQYFYNANKFTESNTIFDITQTDIEGQENFLWVTTEDRGIAGFNTITHNFQLYLSDLQNDPKGIKGTTYGLYANKHALWIGSNSGLHCYHYNKQIFNAYPLKGITGKNSPVSDIIIEKTSNGNDKMLWLYIAYKDAYRYNMETKTVLPVPNKIKKYIEPQTNFFGWFIDSQNRLWISTGQYGLIGYDIEKDFVFLQEKNIFYQSWEWVNTFFEDNKNNIWFGTFNGMYKRDAQSGKIEAVTVINKQFEANYLSKAIMDITEDEKQQIWFITDFSDDKIAAIAKYTTESNQIQIVYNEQKESLSFAPPVELTSLLSDQHGKLYVNFNRQEIKWFTDPDKNKLVWHSLLNAANSGNSVNELIGTDQYHNVWIQNSFGLLYLKKESNTLVNYPFLNYGLDNNANDVFFFKPIPNDVYWTNQ